LVVGLAGLPGFFQIIEDKPEKSSVVCLSSQTTGMAGNGAIETIDKLIERPKAEGKP